MDMKFLIFILFQIVHNVIGQTAEIVVTNVTLTWSGGSPLCLQCSNLYSSSFACSANGLGYSAGNWANGTKTFIDPLNKPSSEYMLSQVTLNLFGLYNCYSELWQITTFRVLLQGTEVTQQVIDQGRICDCMNCVEELTTPSIEYTYGWPKYNYMGTNTLEVVVDQNQVCLSSILVTLVYTKVSSGDGDNDGTGISRTLLWVIVGLLGFLFLVAILLGTFLIRRYCSKKAGYMPIHDPSGVGYMSMSTVLDGSEILMGMRIGKGSYGEVYKAEWRGLIVAVKRLPTSLLQNKEFLEDFKREAAIMSTLRHPNTLQFLGTCNLGQDICIVTEYMARGSLYKILHDDSVQIDYSMIKKFALDVTQGMLYLHNLKPHPILHRDLKSHNLLVDDHYRVKISDFGLSKVVEKTNGTMTSCGTPAWAAPEVLKNSHYTEKADVYSFGICLWEFYTRKDPYEGMPTFQIVFVVGNQGERPTIPESCPEDYKRLMVDCWDGDYTKRPSFEEVLKRIKLLNTDNQTSDNQSSNNNKDI